MPNTYSQIYIQIVFAVRGRENFISEKFKDTLEKYICGIVNNNKSKPLAIYCNPDHIHILIGLHPSVSISEMARIIKANSSKWINENKFTIGKFNWQEGFGAFSYSKSQIDHVAKYILNQQEHHKRTSFKDEYLSILQKAEIEYKDQYLFEWYD
jgi:putative transposase